MLQTIQQSRNPGRMKILLKGLVKVFFATILMTGLHVQAQDAGKISGMVTDENDKPLEGVTVSVKTSGKASVTNAEGRFSISAAEGNVLEFSYTGFATAEKMLAKQPVVNVQLKKDGKLMEEVYIGYQKQRKSDLTGAVSSVKASELNRTTPTLSQALVGKVAGVQVSQVSGAPYAGTKIRVRGIGSVNASSEPLYVIDGYPVGGNVNSGPGNSGNGTNGYNPATSGNDIFINPDDIESIEILKDAASAAIYGSRAAAGVVLITTKHGKLGKGKFDYDYQIGVNQLAHKVKMMDASEFAQMFIDGRNNNYHDVLVAKGVVWNDAFYSDDNATRTAKGGGGSSNILAYLYDFKNQKMIPPKYNTDWQDALYRNAIVQRHNLSLSGGKEGIRYAISAGYMDQPGIIVSTFQKRINFRANVDADINRRFKISTNVAITSNDNREVQEGRFDRGAILGALVYMPFFPLYNEDGTLQLGRAAEQTDGFGYSFQGIENPVALAERVNITRKGLRGTYNASALYQLLPSLSAKVNLGVQTYNEKYEYYYPTNLSSGTNPPGSAQAIAAANTSAQTMINMDKLAEFTLNYKKEFNKHRIDAIAGYTTQKTTSDIVSVGANGFINDIVPEITSRGALATNFYLNGGTGKSTTTLISYLARALYSYNGKYFLSASIRSDGSSRFGPNSRFGTFPSVSAGWNLSNESFYHDWLGQNSTVKLRASWGLSGNNNIGNYRFQQLISNPSGTVFGPGTVHTANWAGNITDANLGWESTSQYNFGADIGLFNGRIGLIVNYYNSKSFNLIYNQTVSALSGSNTILTNLKNSDIRNQGFDLQVDANIIRKRDINFTISGNITANENDVRSLGGATEIYVAGAERSYTTHVTREGQPIGMFYGIKVGGMVREADMAAISADRAVYLANNNSFPSAYKRQGVPISTYSSTPLQPGDLWFIDKNGDGIINESDKDIIGSPYPKFTYGFNLSFSYKMVDLSASFNGSQGNEVIDGQDYYIRNMEGSGNQYKQLTQRYRSEAEPGNGHDYRASRGGTQSNSTRLSDYYLQDGSFFRCTNITLGFDVPANATFRKLGISSMRLYASADNAFTITKYLGYNPEVDYNNGSNLSPGVDYGKYPLVRAYSVGVRMGF